MCEVDNYFLCHLTYQVLGNYSYMLPVSYSSSFQWTAIACEQFQVYGQSNLFEPAN